MSKNTNLSFLTDYITADITNGRIGINNASPAVAFDVVGVVSTSTSTYLATASGNVGIGTTSPTSLSQFQKFLHIAGGASNNSALCLSGQNTGGQGTIGYDSSVLYIDALGATTGANNTITFNTTSVNSSNGRLERMRITAAGSLQVGGTTEPGKISLFQSDSKVYSSSGNFDSDLFVVRVNGSIVSNQTASLQLVASGNNGTNAGRAIISVVQTNQGLSSGDIVLQNNSGGTIAERMRITSGGNVGIGTITPKSYGALTINGQTIGLSNIAVDINQAFKFNNYYSSSAGSDKTISTGYAGSVGFDNSVGALTFSNSSSSVTADGNIVTSERMRITSTGSVGIGNTYEIGSPYLTLALGGSKHGIIVVRNASSSDAGYVYSDSSTSLFTVAAAGANPLLLSINNAERMRITSAGEVLMHNTTYNSTNDGQLFGNGGETYFTKNAGSVLHLNRRTDDGVILFFQKNLTNVGSISTNTYSLPSDLNFKKNINNLDLGLNLVDKLRPVSYNHKIDDEGSALSTGFIAQELEQSLTELGVNKNEYYILQHKPNEDKTQSQYWLDYTKMIPILVKAIQELSTEINLLKQK
jgi:hypothetical protein